MLRSCYILLLFFGCHAIYAWENHAMLTKTVLQAWQQQDTVAANYLDQSVAVESLQSFLQSTKKSLPSVLNNIEIWARQHESGYRPLPASLIYQPSKTQCANHMETCFKQSIRINLDVPLNAIVYDPQHDYPSFTQINMPSQILPGYFPLKLNIADYKLVPDHAKLKIKDILATASLQPDFGMDSSLYEDSGTSFGKIYGFGKQPLGDPSISLYSQMMFHMSSYHDAGFVFWFKPRLKETYPEYRAYLYMQLSQFAAETKHPYWAAVFLGWGLHYIQDATQPWHTQFLYGLTMGTIRHVIFSPITGLQNIQTNRHILFENIANQLIMSASDTGRNKNMLQSALSHPSAVLPSCDLSTQFLRHENHNKINYVSILQASLPDVYVNSPAFQISSVKDYAAFVNAMTPTARMQLSKGIATAFTQYANYTRACIVLYANLSNL